MTEVARRLRMRAEVTQSPVRPPVSDPSSVTNKNELILNAKRASSDINLSDHQKTLNKILHRRRHTSERLVTTPRSGVLTSDTRWVSSEALTIPWSAEDKWWLTGTKSFSFLDTQPRVFGSKTVFLIGKKLPKSESDLTISQHKPKALNVVKMSRRSTLYLSTPV